MKINPEILRELSAEYAIIGERLEGEDKSKMMDVAHALNAGADGIERNTAALDTLTKVRETLDRLDAHADDLEAHAQARASTGPRMEAAGVRTALIAIQHALGDTP